MTRYCWHFPHHSDDTELKHKKLHEYIALQQGIMPGSFWDRYGCCMNRCHTWNQPWSEAKIHIRLITKSDLLLLRRLFIYFPSEEYLITWFWSSQEKAKSILKSHFTFTKYFLRNLRCLQDYTLPHKPNSLKVSAAPKMTQCVWVLQVLCYLYCTNHRHSHNRLHITNVQNPLKGTAVS